MKKRTIRAIIAIIMVLCILPSPVLGAEEYNISVTSDCFGNISYNKTISFDIAVVSPYSEDISLRVKAVNEYGMVKFESRKEVKLTAGVSTNFSFKVNVDAYGVYVLNTSLYAGGEKVCINDTDFSVIKTTQKVNREMGIHTLFNNDEKYHKDYIPEITDLYSDIGVSIRRTSWSWDRIERNKGEYKLTSYIKKQYDILKEDGRDLLLTLCMGNAYHTSGSSQAYAKTEKELEKWKEYCYNTALLAKDLPVTFEVMNEFDMKSSNEEEYYNILKYAYEGVKDANPAAKVLGMVCSNGDTTENSWMRRVLELGAAQYLDGIAFHPYTWDMSPDRYGWAEYTSGVKKMMEEYGIGDKELWISEVGWYKNIGREKQASYNVRALALNKINDCIDKTIFYRYAYAPNIESDEGFGFIESVNARTPFSAFPVLPAISNYNDIMTNAKFSAAINDICYMYTLENGKKCIMLWADNQELVTLDLNTEFVLLTDMYGNEKVVFGENGKFTFVASDNISYITGDFTDAKISDETLLIDKAIAHCGNMEFDTVKTIGEKAEIISSENVSAFVYDNTKIAVLNHSSENGYVNINLTKNGKCIFYGKIKVIKNSFDKNVVYDLNYDAFDRDNYITRGIYYDYVGDEEALCFRFTNSHTRRLLTPRFENPLEGEITLSYDLYLTGNANVYLSNYHGGEFFNYGGVNDEGNFVYGTSESFGVEKNYELNKWYRVEAIIDTNTKTLISYVDGEYIGKIKHSNIPTELSGLCLGVNSAENMSTFVKNLRVSYSGIDNFGIDNIEVAADNSYAIIEFSDAIINDTIDIGIADAMTKKTVNIYITEKLTSTKYKIYFKEPLQSCRAYTAYKTENIESAIGALSRMDYTFISNKTSFAENIKAVYTFPENTGNVVNNAIAGKDIVVELSGETDESDISGLRLCCDNSEIEFHTENLNDRFYSISPVTGFIVGEKYKMVLGNDVVNFIASDYFESISSLYNSDMFLKKEIFYDDFEEYEAVQNADIHPLTFIENGKWEASGEVESEHSIGAGHYVYEYDGDNKLRGDAWQNELPFSTQARAILCDEPMNCGTYEISFDLWINELFENSNNSSFGVFTFLLKNNTNEYPVFKVENNKMMCYNSLIHGNAVVVSDFESNPTKPVKMVLIVDVDERIVKICIKNDNKTRILYETKINPELAEDGFNKLVFEQYDDGNVLQENASHLIDNVLVEKYDGVTGIKITKDDKDFQIGELNAGDEISVSVSIDNSGGENLLYTLVCAFYDEKCLQEIHLENVNILENETGMIERKYNFIIPTSDMLSVKCFIVEGAESMIPVFNAVSK